jgi:hypothetical protein
MSPKIIQILVTPNDDSWQGMLLGLSDDGVVYRVEEDGWVAMIKPLTMPPPTDPNVPQTPS